MASSSGGSGSGWMVQTAGGSGSSQEAERWIAVWADGAAGAATTSAACAEGEAPSSGRFNASCVWQYGHLIPAFAADFSRQQLRAFLRAYGSQVSSISRDGLVSIHGGGSAAAGAMNASSAGVTDATPASPMAPITDALKAQLRTGVEHLSVGEAAASAGTVTDSSSSAGSSNGGGGGGGSTTSASSAGGGSVSTSSVQPARWGLDRIDQVGGVGRRLLLPLCGHRAWDAPQPPARNRPPPPPTPVAAQPASGRSVPLLQPRDGHPRLHNRYGGTGTGAGGSSARRRRGFHGCTRAPARPLPPPLFPCPQGIRVTHQEFLYIDGRNGSRASEAYATLPPAGDNGDCEGHGTHVAAAVGGLTFGVAKNVTLHAVRAGVCVCACVWWCGWVRGGAGAGQRPARARNPLLPPRHPPRSHTLPPHTHTHAHHPHPRCACSTARAMARCRT